MGLIDEACHDAKISAAAAQGPEEVLMLRRIGGHKAPVGQHDIRLDQVVNGQAVLAREIAVAAAERKAPNAGRRDDPGRYRQSKRMTGVIHVALRAARFRPHGAVRRVDAHPLHQGEVYHQPVIAAAQSGPVVAAAADGGEKIILPAKSHGGDHIGDIGTASDEKRPLVDHGVVQLAGLLVMLVTSLDQFAAQARFEFSYDCIVQHDFLLFNSGIESRGHHACFCSHPSFGLS